MCPRLPPAVEGMVTKASPGKAIAHEHQCSRTHPKDGCLQHSMQCPCSHSVAVMI